MASFGGLGLALTAVFGCLLLAFVGEVYYLLWWKRKKGTAIHSNAVTPSPETETDYTYTHYAKDLLHLICWKNVKPAEQSNIGRNSDSVDGAAEEEDPELGNSKDLLLKATFADESVESELMRIHNLGGPPRFLFTIKEETKEDLESEDGKSTRKGSRTRSLSDLILALDPNTTPFLTPLASPPLKCCQTPLNPHDQSYSNPLFEASVVSSPPPKFKFLRDAEEKLYRRLKEEAAARMKATDAGGDRSDGLSLLKEIQIQTRPQCIITSSSTQVLPLESSPTTTTFRPPSLMDKNNPVVR